MEENKQKTTNNKQLLFGFILNPKRITFFAIAIFVFTTFAVVNLQKNVYAATGINRTINFQGKVVNKDGTNVADGQYTFVFKLYDDPSAGANPWTETQNNVQVTAGIFRVSLGSVTTFASAGIDFNTDNLYLGINFNSDGEMTPRVRFAAVPYAINAEKVAGLTVSNTTGTLTIPNSKTVQFGGAFTTSAQDLTLTLGGTTNVTLPTTGTLATLAGVENLSNKTFTTSITVSGVTTDLTTGTNENLTIAANGTGNVLIQSGSGGQAALIVDKTGLGDIFAASASGVTKFVIKSDGTASSSAGFTVDGVGSLQSTNNQTLTVGGGSTGDLVIGRASQTVQFPGFLNCSALETVSGVLGCGTDDTGVGGSGANFWQYNSTTGIVANGNLTTDFLLGGTSTQSAMFSVLGIAAGTNPSASVSATQGANAGKGIYMSGDGSLQSVRNNTLTIGGNTTGDIIITPRNGSGTVTVNGTLAAKTGRTATLTVAANDSSSTEKLQADYVADGAGGTDDAATIESAIAALPVGGGSIVLLDGTFHLDSSVDLTASNVTISGQGKSTILLRKYNETVANTSGVITIGNASTTVDNVTISDLYINGDRTTYTNANNHGILLKQNITNTKILGLTIRNNSGEGIKLNNASTLRTDYITIKDSDIEQNTRDGVSLGTYNSFIVIDHNVISRNDINGVDISGAAVTATSSAIVNNVINNNGTYGININTSTHNNIATNEIKKNGSYGIYLQTSSNNSISGNSIVGNSDGIRIHSTSNYNSVVNNVFASSTNIGVWMTGGSYNNITGNNIYANVVDGIQIQSDLNVISGNSISGNSQYGIQSNSGNQNQITGNLVTENAKHGIYLTSSSNNVVSENKIYNNGASGTFDGINVFLSSSSNKITNNDIQDTAGSGYAIDISFSTATSTILSNNTFSGTGATSINDIGTGTIYNNQPINTSGDYAYKLTRALGIGTLTPQAVLEVNGGTFGGNASLVVNQSGNSLNDIFTASASGVTKFTIKNDGTASSSAGFTVNGVGGLQSTKNQTLTIGGGSTGDLVIGRASQNIFLPGFDCSGSGNGGKLTTTSGGILTCSADTSGAGGGGDNFWQYDITTGIIANGNLTTDFLLGGTSTQSAMFSVLGIAAGTNPSASVSATQGANATKGIYMSGDGSLQSVRNNSLTLGGNTTGNISLSPLNNLGGVSINKTTGPLASLDVKDLSSVASAGSEKINVNGSSDRDFSSDTGKWTAAVNPENWAIYGGKLNKATSGTTAVILDNTALDSAAVSGTTYQVVFTFTTTASSSGNLTPSFGGTNGVAIGQDVNMSNTQTQVIVAGGTGTLNFTPTSGWYGTIDNVSVKQITTSSVALRLEASDGITNPLEIRTGGDALGNIFIGNGSGRSDTTGSQSTGVGYKALYSNTTGNDNTAYGYEALFSNTTGGDNTANGWNGLFNNTTGNDNTANGYKALFSNTTGSNNTANGWNALFSNTTGSNNTANGVQALFSNTTGSSNTANGLQALIFNTTGSNNTANGYRALLNNTTGGSNTANGYNSGLTNTVGGSNSFYGYLADVSLGNLINATAIGANAYVSGNDSLVLGSIYGVNSATGSARIGIGTTSPKYILDVTGGYGSNALVSFNQTNGNDIFTASSSGVTKFTIKNDGTASTSGNLVINAAGSLQTTNNQTLTIGGNSTGNIFFKPGNSSTSLYLASNGSAGFGTTNPLASLDLRANLTNGGTIPVASISGATSYASLVIDNSGTGDLLTASTSGTTKFTITNRGSVIASDFVGHDVILGTSSASLISAYKGFNGYTNFSGGIGTGGIGTDSITNAQRITSTGNLTNIGSIQAGEVLLTKGGTFDTKADYTTGANPHSVAIGDLNGDGKADMAVANYGAGTGNSVSVLINNGNGTFAAKADYTVGTGPSFVAIGDLNGDGKADLAVTNCGTSCFTGGGTGNSVSVLINNGKGTFAAKADYTVGTNPYSVAIGDLNGDGKADMAVVDGADVYVLINNGNGTFTSKLALENLFGISVAIGDLNGDGKADLVIADVVSYNYSVWFNDGNGNFTTSTTGGTMDNQPYSVAIGDLNGDGKADIVVDNMGDFGDLVSVFINNGNGTFAAKVDYTVGSSPYSVAIGDLNGDGKADLATANISSTVSVLINNGNGTFAAKVDYTTGSSPYSVAIGDLNGDGKADLAVANSFNGAGGNSVSVFINHSTPIFYVQASSGNVGIGTAAPFATLHVVGGDRGGSASAIFNQIGASTNDILAASSSGVTKFVIKNDGTASSSAGFTVDGVGSIQSTKNQTLTIGGNSTGNVVIKPGNTAGLTFDVTGKVGVGTSNPQATLDVRSQNGTLPVASVAGATSFAGLIVDNSGSGDIFTASSSGLTRFTIQQTGTVLIGSTSNGLQFDYLNGGPTYTGTGRPTKTIILSPEYAGAVLTASGSATTTGSITSDASASAQLNRTYYEWSSTAASLNDYVVAVRVTLPADFSGWTSGNTMTISYNTGSSVTATNGLDVYMYNSVDDSTGRPVYFSTNNVSAKSWTTINLTAGQLDNGASPDWNAAGETVTIYLKMKASGTYNYTQIGDIVINYLSKF